MIGFVNVMDSVVILFSLCPASLKHKNPKRLKISYSMCPAGCSKGGRNMINASRIKSQMK